MSKFFSDLFDRDNHRCVYCGRDLMVDFESFMLTQEDHLISRKSGGEDDELNRVIACYVCNVLKGDFCPPIKLTSQTKTRYIDAVRDHIMARRSKHMRDFASWTHEEKEAVEPPQPLE
jgi:hypothetical protein